jgi:hypothetical protein
MTIGRGGDQVTIVKWLMVLVSLGGCQVAVASPTPQIVYVTPEAVSPSPKPTARPTREPTPTPVPVDPVPLELGLGLAESPLRVLQPAHKLRTGLKLAWVARLAGPLGSDRANVEINVDVGQGQLGTSVYAQAATVESPSSDVIGGEEDTTELEAGQYWIRIKSGGAVVAEDGFELIEATFEELLATAPKPTYDQLFRDEEKWQGRTIYLRGEVIQVLGDESGFEMRVSITLTEFDFWDDPVYVFWQGERFLEEDIVEIIGTAEGLITYESTMGGDITIPQVEATHMRLDQ